MPLSLNQHWGPSGDALLYVLVSLLLGSTEIHTALQWWSHKGWVEGTHHLL